MKTLIAWFAKHFKKESPVSDDTQAAPDVAAQAAAATAAALAAVQPAAAAAPVAAVVTPAETDTDKLKALLVALGHDVTAEWEHLIALAKKA